MIVKDVISQGMRAGVHLLGQPGLVSRRLLAAGFGGTTAHLCVLFGALSAPVLSLIGWIGLVLPETTSLHHAAAGLLVSAMIGLGAALVGAHNAKDVPHPHGQ